MRAWSSSVTQLHNHLDNDNDVHHSNTLPTAHRTFIERARRSNPNSTMANANFLDKGIEIVQKAIDEDVKQNYVEAYKQYQNALEYFMMALK
ncbi:hypothetical protein CF326_g7508, partial [Tilletia indica]